MSSEIWCPGYIRLYIQNQLSITVPVIKKFFFLFTFLIHPKIAMYWLVLHQGKISVSQQIGTDKKFLMALKESDISTKFKCWYYFVSQAIWVILKAFEKSFKMRHKQSWNEGHISRGFVRAPRQNLLQKTSVRKFQFFCRFRTFVPKHQQFFTDLS